MNRPVDIATRPQLALQSYLDALLQDATEELTLDVGLDEFQAAVLEEQARDALARVALTVGPVAVPVAAPVDVVAEVVVPTPLAWVPKVIEAEPVIERAVALVEPVVEVYLPSGRGTPPPSKDGRPAWPPSRSSACCSMSPV